MGGATGIPSGVMSTTVGIEHLPPGGYHAGLKHELQARDGENRRRAHGTPARVVDVPDRGRGGADGLPGRRGGEADRGGREGVDLPDQRCSCRKPHPSWWSRCTGEADVVRDGGQRGARATGERCGMVIDRAAATGLSRYDERVRVAAAAAGEQPGQRRGDPRAAPPALGPAATAWFTPADRALLAALLHRLPSDVLKRLHLVVRPDTVLRWHRDVVVRRHAQRSRPRRPGRPRTVRSIRVLVLRLVRENPGWGYRRVHGELLVLGVKVAASTVWEILHHAGIDPAPQRSSTTG